MSHCEQSQEDKKYLQVLFVTKQTNNSKAITFKTISGEKNGRVVTRKQFGYFG